MLFIDASPLNVRADVEDLFLFENLLDGQVILAYSSCL